MAQELLYTSAPEGLRAGSRGFCTVLSTQGMSAPVATCLESLSGYRAIFPSSDPQAALNPVAFSHLRIKVAGKSYNVLSRIAASGLDYSQRSNKLAHHIALEPNERVAAGPAEVLLSSPCVRSSWDGKPRIVASGPNIAIADPDASKCIEWERRTGDAGWAGVVADTFLADQGRLVYLIFEPGMEMLPLVCEAIRLLPPEVRWDVSFSTYFTKLPKGIDCVWRCVLRGSPEANEARRFVNALKLDLTEPLPKASGGPLVEFARTEIWAKGSVAAPLDPGQIASQAESLSPEPVPVPLQDAETAYALRAANSMLHLPPPLTVPPKPGKGQERSRSRSRLALIVAAIVLLLLVPGTAAVIMMISRTANDVNSAIALANEEKSEQSAHASGNAPGPSHPKVDEHATKRTDAPSNEPDKKASSTGQHTDGKKDPDHKSNETKRNDPPVQPKKTAQTTGAAVAKDKPENSIPLMPKGTPSPVQTPKDDAGKGPTDDKKKLADAETKTTDKKPPTPADKSSQKSATGEPPSPHSEPPDKDSIASQLVYVSLPTDRSKPFSLRENFPYESGQSLFLHAPSGLESKLQLPDKPREDKHNNALIYRIANGSPAVFEIITAALSNKTAALKFHWEEKPKIEKLWELEWYILAMTSKTSPSEPKLFALRRALDKAPENKTTDDNRKYVAWAIFGNYKPTKEHLPKLVVGHITIDVLGKPFPFTCSKDGQQKLSRENKIEMQSSQIGLELEKKAFGSIAEGAGVSEKIMLQVAVVPSSEITVETKDTLFVEALKTKWKKKLIESMNKIGQDISKIKNDTVTEFVNKLTNPKSDISIAEYVTQFKEGRPGVDKELTDLIKKDPKDVSKGEYQKSLKDAGEQLNTIEKIDADLANLTIESARIYYTVDVGMRHIPVDLINFDIHAQQK